MSFIRFSRTCVKRGKPFTEQEKLLLYQCMLPDLDVIDNKAMDSQSVVRKANAWKRVTVRFNTTPSVVCPRTTEQLKKCFENAKCRRQWVVPPDFASGKVEQTQANVNARSVHLGEFFQSDMSAGAVDINGEVVHNFQNYHPNTEERLDIKCELVDITDGPDESSNQEANSSKVHINLQPVQVFTDDTNTQYREEENLEERLTDPISDDLEDVTRTIFMDQSIYRTGEHSRSYTTSKRRRREYEESNESSAKVRKNAHLEGLEERLLRAQVREAEAAASAAELQLQLNQLALQHAQAEEDRRLQLHALRIRQLTQLVGGLTKESHNH